MYLKNDIEMSSNEYGIQKNYKKNTEYDLPQLPRRPRQMFRAEDQAESKWFSKSEKKICVRLNHFAVA